MYLWTRKSLLKFERQTNLPGRSMCSCHYCYSFNSYWTYCRKTLTALSLAHNTYSKGPLWNNTMTDTQACDEWAVTFTTSKGGLRGCMSTKHLVTSLLY